MTFPEIRPLLRRGFAVCLPQWLADGDHQQHLVMGTYGDLIVVRRDRDGGYYWMSSFTNFYGEESESSWVLDLNPGFTLEALGIIVDRMEGPLGTMERRGPKFGEVSAQVALPARGYPALGAGLTVRLP